MNITSKRCVINILKCNKSVLFGEWNTLARELLQEALKRSRSNVERLVPSGVFHPMHCDILKPSMVYRLSPSYVPKKDKTMKTVVNKRIVPKRIIFGGDKVVVVFWPDGEKMVTKVSGGDQWDPEIGVLVCYYRRLMERTRKEAGKDFRWIKDELLKDYLMDVVVKELGLKRDACKRGGQNEKHLRFITGLVQEHMGKQ